MKALLGIIATLSFPLLILNTLGGIVSGIWLAVLGEWRVIGLGVGFFVFSTIVLSFALLPSILLAGPAAYFAEKKKLVGFVFFGALSNLYTIALITLWCCSVLFIFVRGATSVDVIPRLVWSYGVAIGPWAYMASKEQGAERDGLGSAFTTFVAELAYILVMLLAVFSSISLFGTIKVFAAVMLVGFTFQIVTAVQAQQEQTSLDESYLLDD